jgi:hypothetical protein
VDEAGPVELWSRLHDWAVRWQLSPPTLSAGWWCLPASYRAAVVDGWITRPLFEPPGDGALDRGDVRFDANYGYAVPTDPIREYADVLRNDGEVGA